MSSAAAGGDEGLLFTSGDRVLLHLLSKGDSSDPVGGISDQDDIAAYCGIGRTHVPRALKPLIADGFVIESQGRAPGRTRRVKVYRLTDRGKATAVTLRDKANEAVIEWIGENGESHSEHCVDALRRINDHLGSRGMNQIPISLFLTMGKQRIGWNDILFLSSTVRSGRMETISLPEGWAPMSPPPVPDQFMDRKDQMAQLGEMIHGSKVSALMGDPGMGKRTLVSAWAMRHGKKVLWIKKEEAGEFSIDPAKYDLIVVMGVSVLDVTSTLLDSEGVGIKDPRDESWPDIMRGLPLLGILDGTMDVRDDRLMSLHGMDEASFVKRASRAGLPKELIIPFFHASKGSPMALEYIDEMEDPVLKSLSSLDEEAAVMSLMLGLRSRF